MAKARQQVHWSERLQSWTTWESPPGRWVRDLSGEVAKRQARLFLFNVGIPKSRVVEAVPRFMQLIREQCIREQEGIWNG